MCLAPNVIDGGVQIACRKCWQCRERAISDWVGRNIAESKTAVACHAVTLTYGRNEANDILHERSVLLTYSDIQKYLKLLRRHGFPVRYFVTGEFGSAKGRAHWHVMLYWLEKVPPHELDTNFREAHWPHGWSFWTEPTHKAVRYNCKYIQKDMGDAERQGHLAMSKKPPLGAAYFARMAEQFVRQGLSPQSLEYNFPDVTRRRNGAEERVPFLLTGRSAELFLEHFIASWEAAYPGRDWPRSELVDLFAEYGRVVTDEALLGRSGQRSGGRPEKMSESEWSRVHQDVQDACAAAWAVRMRRKRAGPLIYRQEVYPGVSIERVFEDESWIKERQ
nr:MAG: replication initiator protein [Microvirus sp.]